MDWKQGRISMFLLGCIGTIIGFSIDGLLPLGVMGLGLAVSEGYMLASRLATPLMKFRIILSLYFVMVQLLLWAKHKGAYPAVIWITIAVLTVGMLIYDRHFSVAEPEGDGGWWLLIPIIPIACFAAYTDTLDDISAVSMILVGVFNFAGMFVPAWKAEKQGYRPIGGHKEEKRIEAPPADEDRHYKTMRLRSDATWEEIKEQYKRLAAKHHPDRFPNAEQYQLDYLEFQMKQINNAYAYFRKKFGSR